MIMIYSPVKPVKHEVVICQYEMIRLLKADGKWKKDVYCKQNIHS